jgi:hypothetical protein
MRMRGAMLASFEDSRNVLIPPVGNRIETQRVADNSMLSISSVHMKRAGESRYCEKKRPLPELHDAQLLQEHRFARNLVP